MDFKVCILAAGKGSRMGRHSEFINKALLPIAGKAVISHIIEKFISKFDTQLEFIIAVGSNSEQVINYLKIAHPELNIKFCYVDKWQGIGTGPGYSLSKCDELLQSSFFIVCSDTLWSESEYLNTDSNWIGVAKFPTVNTERFCSIISSMKTRDVDSIIDKRAIDLKNFALNNPNKLVETFIGLGFIRDYQIFFNALKRKEVISGELQLSTGFSGLLENCHLKSLDISSWQDVGTIVDYQKIIKKNQAYDFSKPGEYIYFISDRVIKLYATEKKAKDCAERALTRPKLFFKPNAIESQFLSYQFIEGETLYHNIDPQLFARFLSLMKNELWQSVNYDRNNYSIDLENFYLGVLEKRLIAYQKLNSDDPMIEKVLSWIRTFNWTNFYSHARASFFHGDLQLDNIIYTPNKEFFLIDPRDLFGHSNLIGDVNYDLAKLYASLLINYLEIKKGKIIVRESKLNRGFAPFYTIPCVDSIGKYRKLFRKFLVGEGLDYRHILTIVGQIYIRMAALHADPFDKVLLHKGIRILNKLRRYN